MIDLNDEVLGIRRRSAATSIEDVIGDGRRLRRAQSCWTLRPTKDADMENLHLKPQVIIRVGLLQRIDRVRLWLLQTAVLWNVSEGF